MGLRFKAAPGDDASEAQFQGWVMARAKQWQWRVNHVYRAQLADGNWRTTCSVGWPDLTMVRDDRIVFAEIKAKRGRLDPAQDAWLDALAEVPCAEVFVWSPKDWRDVVRVLAPT